LEFSYDNNIDWFYWKLDCKYFCIIVDLKLKSLDNKILVRSKRMEILFYVGMIMFGFYCLVTEPLENVERDFGMYGVRNEEDK
tara:strand:- start:677 stop:925 length:249 start_codon:yes stop_codon:yes gene_type:complete